MTVAEVNTVVTEMTFAPEIQRARASIDLPEVREMMKRLSAYNLGVCIPHMHRPDMDFAALPADTVQVEENGYVTWVRRSEMSARRASVPVAWRWAGSAVVADIECIQTCSPNPTKGHRRGHL